ncbi:uncharacterized protein LOC135102473 [Scylla paramamosain]|uniref:uncharacterized protein LOC135102473 n=1 Tax=Scylla paramamosain TaxID=85552 RepID=UPI0030826FD5
MRIRKAFHKSESKKEFSVVTNLSTMAVCATTPVLPTAVASQDLKPHQVVVPQVQVTEVKVPDCYEDPEDTLSRLPPPPPPPVLPSEEVSSSSPSKSPKKQPARSASANTASSTSPPSSPPSSPPATSTKPSTSPTTPATTTSPSKDESQKEASVGETKANGAAKTTSPTKVPFSTFGNLLPSDPCVLLSVGCSSAGAALTMPEKGGGIESCQLRISSSRPALCQNQDKSANAKSHLEEPEAGISIPPSLVPLPLVKPKSLVC